MKKGLLLEAAPKLILIVVAFLIILMFNQTLFGAVKKSSADKTCAASVVISSASKIGGSEVQSIHCPLSKEHIVEISAKSLDKNKNAVNAIITDRGFSDSNKGGTAYKIYNLNKLIVEKEMKPCWEKMGKGQYDLFSDWEKFINWEAFGSSSVLAGPFSQDFQNALFKDPPTFCVLCSQISFDEGIKNIVSNYNDPSSGTSISLYEWLRLNPVQPKALYGDITYDRWFEDQDVASLNPIFTAGSNYAYDVSKTMAVVFARVNVPAELQAGQWVIQKINLIDEKHKLVGADALMLMPLDEVAERCDYVES